MAARPAAVPLVVPINPPKIIADCGVFNPMYGAIKGVPMVTKIDFTTPAAMLIAMISELAPRAVPVTGPTTKVQAPAPMVVRLSASVIPME